MDKFAKRLGKIKKPMPIMKKRVIQEPEPPFLTFVVTCMGRLEFIKQTIPTVISQPNTKYVFVDWSDPDNAGYWVEKNHPYAKVVRVPDQTKFHLSRARNIGGKAVDTPWICFIDSDVKLHPSFSSVVKSIVRDGIFCIFENGGPIEGTIVVSKDDFQKSLFNEKMIGWGWEDVDFKITLQKNLTRCKLDNALAKHINHGNDYRVKFYDEKNIWASNAKNSWLRRR